MRLTRIYTKTGDTGTTMLGDGTRVPKDDLRVDAYGEVDEANAAIGVVLSTISSKASPGSAKARIRDMLISVQHDLFDVGADLCCPIEGKEQEGEKLRVESEQVDRLERAIDEHNERLEALDSFVLPGGTDLAAALHMARTVTRRAERVTARLLDRQPGTTNPQTLRYLNRLSDLLFVFCRVANEDGRKDVKWIPGANRPRPA